MCGLVVTVIVLAVMPKSHASNAQVWTEFHNKTGGWSDGVCFMTGLLNGAFAVGVPDCISHLSEEGTEPPSIILLVPMLYILTIIYSAKA
jgi:amino acid transporter